MMDMEDIGEILEVRKNFYAFLYRMYLEEPPKEFLYDIACEKIDIPYLPSLDYEISEISEGFEILKAYGEGNIKNLDELYEKLVDEYTHLFIGPYKLPVQPYESMWIANMMGGEPLLNVKEVYRKAGISKSKNYPEPEDHIAFELRFMHHLCEEVSSESKDVEQILDSIGFQKTFLNDHLLKWIPNFCDALYNYEKSDFYKGIAKITKGFISMDLKMVEEIVG